MSPDVCRKLFTMPEGKMGDGAEVALAEPDKATAAATVTSPGSGSDVCASAHPVSMSRQATPLSTSRQRPRSRQRSSSEFATARPRIGAEAQNVEEWRRAAVTSAELGGRIIEMLLFELQKLRLEVLRLQDRVKALEDKREDNAGDSEVFSLAGFTDVDSEELLSRRCR